jgi:hypothetical protein
MHRIQTPREQNSSLPIWNYTLSGSFSNYAIQLQTTIFTNPIIAV